MRKQKINFNQKNQTKMSNLKRFNEAFGDDQENYDDDRYGDDYDRDYDDEDYWMDEDYGDRYVDYGVWDLEDIEVLGPGKYEDRVESSKASRWKQQYPDFGVAQCDMHIIFLSRKPTKNVSYTDYHGSFEGHGTLAVIDNCPKRILIIGQND